MTNITENTVVKNISQIVINNPSSSSIECHTDYDNTVVLNKTVEITGFTESRKPFQIYISGRNIDVRVTIED